MVRSAPQITTCSASSTSQITDIDEITEYAYFDNNSPIEIDYIRNNLNYTLLSMLHYRAIGGGEFQKAS
jgi:hypothetical protein